MSTSPATPEKRYSYPALLPCGCPDECDCPPTALAATGFFAVVALVLMSPVLFEATDPLRRPDLGRTVKIGMGVFLVLAALQFSAISLAVLAAVLADRGKAAVRIWGMAKALVGGILGSAGGVGAMVLLWGLLSLG